MQQIILVIKDYASFFTGEAFCYRSASGRTYTRSDILRLVDGDEDRALSLFDRAEYEDLEDLLKEHAQ